MKLTFLFSRQRGFSQPPSHLLRQDSLCEAASYAFFTFVTNLKCIVIRKNYFDQKYRLKFSLFWHKDKEQPALTCVWLDHILYPTLPDSAFVTEVIVRQAQFFCFLINCMLSAWSYWVLFLYSFHQCCGTGTGTGIVGTVTFWLVEPEP